jgi:hypothetical protein
VTREISDGTVSPGGTTTVKLHINLGPEHTYWLLEESVPSEFEVTKGAPDARNMLKLIKIQNAESTVEEYQVKAPNIPGTYTFSGEYALEGMEDPVPIMGDTQIVVQ